MSRARHLVPWLAAGLLVAAAAFSPARAAEPDHDGRLGAAGHRQTLNLTEFMP